MLVANPKQGSAADTELVSRFANSRDYRIANCGALGGKHRR
jgi:hypothetical protein